MWRQIIATLKTRRRPPTFMLPEVMTTLEQFNALKVADRILSEPEPEKWRGKDVVKLCRWWQEYWKTYNSCR